MTQVGVAVPSYPFDVADSGVEKARTVVSDVHKAQKAVEEADQALITTRNSGASEGMPSTLGHGPSLLMATTDAILTLEAKRHEAQQALDAAYKALIDQSSVRPVDKFEEDEAVATDDESDGEEAASSMADSSMMSFGDDDEADEDYVPPAH